MSQETNKEQSMSPEEIAQRRKDLIAYYKNQTDLLNHQEKYEKILADIEEHRLRRFVAMVRQAQITNPQATESDSSDAPAQEESSIHPPDVDTHEQESAPRKVRTLKKD